MLTVFETLTATGPADGDAGLVLLEEFVDRTGGVAVAFALEAFDRVCQVDTGAA
jgi:hypothetical protein